MTSTESAATSPSRIPCVLNPAARRASGWAEAIGADSRLQLRECPPEKMQELLRKVIDGGARRVAVVGGDGTVATAAGIVAGTDIELAIIPGGTLNHFARTHRIPTEVEQAMKLAVEGAARPVDLGYVNDVPFLNTSTVGAYLSFVRTRDRWEPRLGYWLSSAWAALRTFRHLPIYSVSVEVEGLKTSYRTPMVFVGVGERELKFPSLGERVADGREGLHAMGVRGGARARILLMTLAASAKGVRHVAGTPHLDSFIAESLSVDLRRAKADVAVDGETIRLETPLNYRLARGTLNLVAPTPEGFDV